MAICGPQGRYFVPFRDISITSRQRRQIRCLFEAPGDLYGPFRGQFRGLSDARFSICGPQGRLYGPFGAKFDLFEAHRASTLAFSTPIQSLVAKGDKFGA